MQEVHRQRFEHKGVRSLAWDGDDLVDWAAGGRRFHPDGREVLVHCPDEYNVLQIEEVESGRRLTERASKAQGFFHSRLQVSPDGRYLLSAGWIWHPWDSLAVYDLAEALLHPESLDARGLLGDDILNVEVAAAAFAGPDTLLVAASTDPYPLDDEAGPDALRAGEIGTWSLSASAWLTRTQLSEPAGILMPLGDFAVAFYDHPKLIDVRTGEITARWPELRTGRQTSSIIWGLEGADRTPPLALDPLHRRFAVADDSGVTAIQLG